MEKVENSEIKNYLEKTLIKKTSENKLFTKVFGKRFVKEQLYYNLITLYTNEFSKTYKGYYNFNDSSITLCTSDLKKTILSVQEFENNKTLMTTAIHEGIHAIFAKYKDECYIRGLKHSTGINEVYEDNTELGRGANEGLTEWICELLGYEISSYKNEVSFIKQLELILGKNRILKLSKGNINGNVSHQLRMNKKDTNIFLAKIDEVYNEMSKGIFYSKYIKYLKKATNMNELTTEEKEDITETLLDLRQSKTILDIRTTEHYQKAIPSENDENKIKCEIEYFDTLLNQVDKQLKRSVANVESSIFDYYFKNKFQSLKKCKDYSNKNIEIFKELSKLMLTDDKDEQLQEYSSYKFLKEFEEYEKELVYKMKFMNHVKNKAKHFRENQKVQLNTTEIPRNSEIKNHNQIKDNREIYK